MGILLAYLLIIFISVFIPIYIFERTKILKELSAILGLLLFIGLFNACSILGSKFNIAPVPPSLNELHEVLWLVIPVVIFAVCMYKERKTKKD